MNKELLNDARHSFIKKYGKTPEEYGFPVMTRWKKGIVFSPSEKESTAFIKSHSLSRGINVCYFILLAVAFSGALLLWYLDYVTHQKELCNQAMKYYFCIVIAFGIISLIGAIIAECKSHKLKKVYENKIILYYY